MITIQHTLVSLLYFNGDIEKLQTYIPYILIPDAIRMFTKRRQYSHFERGLNHDVSWLKYPLFLKHISENQLEKYLVDEIAIPNCCIGEETILETFEQHNQHLPSKYHDGVALHLCQDRVFDTFVRTVFDCEEKYDDIFIVNGDTIDGNQFRNVINKMEQQGVYVLAKIIYDKYHIKTNQKWFDTYIYPILQDMYSADMTENTYKYMCIDSQIDTWISNCDFTHMDKDFVISQARLEDMYHNVQITSRAYVDIK